MEPESTSLAEMPAEPRKKVKEVLSKLQNFIQGTFVATQIRVEHTEPAVGTYCKMPQTAHDSCTIYMYDVIFPLMQAGMSKSPITVKK